MKVVFILMMVLVNKSGNRVDVNTDVSAFSSQKECIVAKKMVESKVSNIKAFCTQRRVR